MREASGKLTLTWLYFLPLLESPSPLYPFLADDPSGNDHTTHNPSAHNHDFANDHAYDYPADHDSNGDTDDLRRTRSGRRDDVWNLSYRPNAERRLVLRRVRIPRRSVKIWNSNTTLCVKRNLSLL